MDGIYPSLTRQMGLMRELDVIAQNIANAGTTGYRSEGLTFSEFIKRAGGEGPSMSMGHVRARQIDWQQGALEKTDGAFDVAIEGDGFFQVAGSDGPLLTRAGSFSLDAAGGLVAADGAAVLDAGGAPIQLVQTGGDIVISADGTISQGGAPVAQLGLFRPDNLVGMERVDQTRFRTDAGMQPAETARVLQGFLEASNTAPVLQIARMIEVQNAYSMGQTMLEREDERLRAMLRVMDQQ